MRWSAGHSEFDAKTSKVTVDGQAVKLTSHEYRVLSYLMHHRDRVVSRTELVEHLYEQDFDRDFEHGRGFYRALAQNFPKT